MSLFAVRPYSRTRFAIIASEGSSNQPECKILATVPLGDGHGQNSVRDERLGGTGFPPSHLSLQYKQMNPNSISATNAPLFLSFALSMPYQMVPVAFETVYLFLVRWTMYLRHHQSAYLGTHVLRTKQRFKDLDSRSMRGASARTDLILSTHNKIRAGAGVSPLTWNQDLWIFASLGELVCLDKSTDGIAGTSSDGLSLLTEGAHARVDREPGPCRHRH